jgi:hypothetical protein
MSALPAGFGVASGRADRRGATKLRPAGWALRPTARFSGPGGQFLEADPTAADSGAYGQVTSGFQSANIPAGLCFQIQACIR